MLFSSYTACRTVLTYSRNWRSRLKLDMNGTNESVASCKEWSIYPEYKANIVIWKVIPPILIIFGTIGNSLSIFVLRRKAIRKSTTALYLTVLAVSDIMVLYTGLFRQWLCYTSGIDIRDLSDFACKMNIWLVYCSLDYSAWILIVVTLERVISAWLPHRAKIMCRKNSAVTYLISVGVFIALLNAHLLYGMVIHDTGESKECKYIDKAYDIFFNGIWAWIDLCVYCVLPFCVIMIGNGLIFTKVVKSQNKVRTSHHVVKTSGERHRHTGSGKHSYMTAILFTLNMVFLISTSPISIYNVGFTYWDKEDDKRTNAQLDLWWAIVNMFMYGNHTFNFFLYCLSGSKFRQEVMLIFCSKPQTPRAPGSEASAQHLLHRVNIDEQSLPPNKDNVIIPTPSPRRILHHQTEMTAVNSKVGCLENHTCNANSHDKYSIGISKKETDCDNHSHEDDMLLHEQSIEKSTDTNDSDYNSARSHDDVKLVLGQSIKASPDSDSSTVSYRDASSHIDDNIEQMSMEGSCASNLMRKTLNTLVDLESTVL